MHSRRSRAAKRNYESILGCHALEWSGGLSARHSVFCLQSGECTRSGLWQDIFSAIKTRCFSAVAPLCFPGDVCGPLPLGEREDLFLCFLAFQEQFNPIYIEAQAFEQSPGEQLLFPLGPSWGLKIPGSWWEEAAQLCAWPECAWQKGGRKVVWVWAPRPLVWDGNVLSLCLKSCWLFPAPGLDFRLADGCRAMWLGHSPAEDQHPDGPYKSV